MSHVVENKPSESCQHDQQEQTKPRVLFGDDAIRHQSAVIQQQVQTFQRMQRVNAIAEQRLQQIMALTPKMCACKFPQYVTRIAAETYLVDVSSAGLVSWCNTICQISQQRQIESISHAHWSADQS